MFRQRTLSESQAKVVLSDVIVSEMLDDLRDGEGLLQRTVSGLVDVVVDQALAHPALQLTVLLQLLQSPAGVRWDSITHTTAVQRIITSVDSSVKPKLFHVLKTASLSPLKSAFRNKNYKAQEIQKWAVQQLGQLVLTRPGEEEQEMVKNCLQILLLMSFCRVSKVAGDVPHCEHVYDGDESLRRICVDTFHRVLSRILNKTTLADKCLQSAKVFNEIAYELIKYQSLILKNSNSVQFKNCDTSVFTSQNKTTSLLSKLQTKDDPSSVAIAVLLSFLTLSLPSQPKEYQDMLLDVHRCYKLSLSSEQKGPSWCDVLMEILLSLLAKDSNFTRVTVNTVLTLIAPQLAVSAADMLGKILLSAEDEEQLQFVDEQEDAGDDETDVTENGDITSDVTSEGGETSETADPTDGESESSSDESEDDDDNEEEVTEEKRRLVEQALGAAAWHGQDSDAESVDMDDEQMAQLDDMLVAAFTQIRKGKNRRAELERSRQMAAYRIKCMDSCKIIANQSCPVSTMLTLISCLHQLSKQSSKDQILREQSACAQKTLRHICTQPKISKASKEEYEAVVEKLTTTLGNERDYSPDVALYLMKVVSVTDDKALTKPVIDLVSATVSNKSSPPTAMLIVQQLLSKYPTVLFPCAKILVKVLQDEYRIYAQTYAAAMLTALLNTDASQRKKQVNSLVLELLDIIPNLLLKISSESVKPKYCTTLVLLLFRCLTIQRSQGGGTQLSEEVLTHVRSLRTHRSKDVRSAVDRLFTISRSPVKPAANGHTKKRKGGKLDSEKGAKTAKV